MFAVYRVFTAWSVQTGSKGLFKGSLQLNEEDNGRGQEVVNPNQLIYDKCSSGFSHMNFDRQMCVCPSNNHVNIAS